MIITGEATLMSLVWYILYYNLNKTVEYADGMELLINEVSKLRQAIARTLGGYEQNVNKI